MEYVQFIFEVQRQFYENWKKKVPGQGSSKFEHLQRGGLWKGKYRMDMPLSDV